MSKNYIKQDIDHATFNIDSAVLIYGFSLENKTYKLLNFIVNCAMLVIYKCIIVRVNNTALLAYDIFISRTEKSDLI